MNNRLRDNHHSFNSALHNITMARLSSCRCPARLQLFRNEFQEHPPQEPLIALPRQEPSQGMLRNCRPEEMEIDLQDINEQLSGISESAWYNEGRWSALFQRQMAEQQASLALRKELVKEQFGDVNSLYEEMEMQGGKKEYFLASREGTVRMTFIEDDLLKLMPGVDLNDTLIQNYLQIMQKLMLRDKQCYVFSTYLIHKLISDMEGDSEHPSFYYSEGASDQARRCVCQNYNRVQRWTRKEDIFSFKALVFPINMFAHWFVVLVTNPEQILLGGQCQIVFCDSMFEMRPFVVESIRSYLQQELFDKKRINIRINESNAPVYQPLLPRQTDTHDCGVYLLAYLEEMLLHPEHLQNLASIANRIKLRCFPRIYLESFRHRILKLLASLYRDQSAQGTQSAIEEHLRQRRELFSGKYPTDGSVLSEKEFQKFMALMRPKGQVSEQEGYDLLVKFNLVTEVNYYEYNPPRAQEREESDSDYV